MERQAHVGISDERVKEVRNEIGRWRGTREKRTRMPAELWAAAVALARTHINRPTKDTCPRGA